MHFCILAINDLKRRLRKQFYKQEHQKIIKLLAINLTKQVQKLVFRKSHHTVGRS